ncbi:flavin reductase family protein [Mariprofundus erugo]|uniref:flavin reductase family protein n=1 Tax=Mariprofundus erugo TaxID=2528639 RepID=UPI0010FD7237|nr:flavin reductase family protein [Mariprofundus erugo]TLS74949.1 flavin reductase family protein [Mariprofundus erugo]
MQINFDQLTTSQRYFQMIQTLVPRPIAWVLSEHENGKLNLAPFSYFSAICADPALVMISVGKKSPGEEKDTRNNIEARRYFVIHIPSMDQLAVMNDSSATMPAGVSEIEQLGLETVALENFPLPRLKDARAAFACELHALHEMGNSGQAVIYGEVKQLYLSDEIIEHGKDGRIKVDAEKLDPVARLGANEYAALSQIIRLPRPA